MAGLLTADIEFSKTAVSNKQDQEQDVWARIGARPAGIDPPWMRMAKA
jgi:hypothetical protein